MNALAQSLMNLGQQREQMQMNEMLTGLNTELNELNVPDATEQPEPETAITFLPKVTRFDMNEAIRKKGVDSILTKIRNPASQEQALKWLDRKFPKIEPQKHTVTDTATGTTIEVLEGTDLYRAVASNPGRFTLGKPTGKGETPETIDFTNTKTGRTVKNIKVGSKTYERFVNNPVWEFGGHTENKKKSLSDFERWEQNPEEFAKFKQAGKSQDNGAEPYFVPVPTSSGYQSFNARTGKLEAALDTSGKPLLPVQADIGLAGGKKAAVEQAKHKELKRASYPKIMAGLGMLESQWALTEQIIDKTIEQIGPFTAGVGTLVKNIPAIQQKDFQQNLQMIAANVGFDKLQAMREASPTGGALGQVSDFENKLLQAVQGSLDQGQSAAQLKKNLENIKSMLGKIREIKRKQFKEDYSFLNEAPMTEQPAAGATKISNDAEYNALPSGSEFIAPDGSRRRKP